MEEKIIEKIKKVLALAGNNPSVEEAKAAALKAQRLMAEYHISEKDLDAVSEIEEISETSVYVGTGNKWKYTLGRLVANNFRCRHYSRNKTSIVFYGYETDTKIAAETFNFLFNMGKKAANHQYYIMKRNIEDDGYVFEGRGVRNAFLVGYLTGIKEVLDKQCTALMLVVPQEVKEGYDRKISGGNFRDIRTSFSVSGYYSKRSRDEGIRFGRETMSSRQIAMN